MARVQSWAAELGFSQIGVTDVDLRDCEPGLQSWLAAGFHGSMQYMAQHGLKRARPAELLPGTVSVLSAVMPYLPADTRENWREQELARTQQPEWASIALYARGRDYHKVLRQRLQTLATRLTHELAPLGTRVFCDSAPVLEVELATRAGLGWRGKHTLLLRRQGGSMMFIGEIYLDQPLPCGGPVNAHCGTCDACLRVCPTQAILAPYRLDARRCIAYLTIEHAGPIPQDLRPLMGNRIFGCDDCQLVCPWNRYAQRSDLPDFRHREVWLAPDLLALWRWSEADFLRLTEGSALRRIGYERWLRNLAVALGNALRLSVDTGRADLLAHALTERAEHPSTLLREHVAWALRQMPNALSAPVNTA